MPSPADIFRQAASLHLRDERREGSTVRLGSANRLLIAGDLHGHAGNLAGLLKRHATVGGILVLQEVIHAPVDPASGVDRSVEAMLSAAQAKIDDPDGIVHLLGNHNVAQVTGSEITKAGRGTLADFAAGVAHCFPDDPGDLLDAIDYFCRSLPLAARNETGLFLAHSLPSPHRMDKAGLDILSRLPTANDFRRPGAVYEWTWGRKHTAQQLDDLANQLDARFFVLGHQHIQTGWEPLPARGIILNSDTPLGCMVDLPAKTLPDNTTIEQYIKPIPHA